MATEVTLPELGESVTEGTITAWLVDVGDTVEQDQPLFELSSDKIDTEVPSPVSGTLTEIKVNVDDTVDVGTVVAVIGDADEAAASDEGGGEAEAEQEAPSDEGGDEDTAPAASAGAAGGTEGGPAEGGQTEGGTEVVLPELGESVTEGTITGWLVEVGDEVEADQPLFELSSDKIDTEVPSPVSGTLTEIKVGVDETVDVGTVVAIIGGTGGGGGQQQAEPQGGEQEQEAPPEQGEPAVSDPTPATSQASEGQRRHDGIMMSPLVRRLVNEHDLDPASIQGSGQGGRITRNDVQKVLSERGAEAGDGGKQPAAASAQQPQQQKRPEAQPSKAPQPERKPAEAGDRVRTEDLSRIRQRIAAKMMESLSNSAQLTTVQEADMSRIMALRGRFKEDFKQREGVSLSPFVFLCRAALIAIKSYEMANAKADWEAGVVTIPQYVNLGIAVDTEKGLLVPNIKNADDLTLPALARSIQDVANKARGKGKLEMRDIEGGTFTMTNTGSRGVLIDTPILNYPEVAILGTGAIQQRPVAVPSPEGPTIGIRSMVYLSLTYDHRLLDGADAARFVTEVKNVVETYDWEQELGY